VLSIGYIFNSTISYFFSASYLVATAARLVLNGLALYLGIRRVMAQEAEILAVLFNYAVITIALELNSYNVNRKTL
jgi:hypothetical protein